MSRRERPRPTDDLADRQREETDLESQTDAEPGPTLETDDYHAAGQQAPGASAPPIPGVDPGEARHLVGRKRQIEEDEDEDDEAERGDDR